MVEQKATVRQLSLQYVGRFDEIVMAEIRTLNPELRDADHLEIGARLRLPLYLRKEIKATGQGAIHSASLESPGDIR